MALNKPAQLWIKALRSQSYKQGKGSLHDSVENRFCCLGVLTDLAIKAGVVTERTLVGGSLSQKVMKWAGIRESFGAYSNRHGLACDLANDNDGWVDFMSKDEDEQHSPKSFKQIAKIIESEPEGLFVANKVKPAPRKVKP